MEPGAGLQTQELSISKVQFALCTDKIILDNAY